MSHHEGWKPGPLPPNTYFWGGVVKVGDDASGFYFADFKGDHVTTCPDGERIEAADVAFYNNALILPIPGAPKSVGTRL